MQYYSDMVLGLSADTDYKFKFGSFLARYSNIVYDKFICLICKCLETKTCKGYTKNANNRVRLGQEKKEFYNKVNCYKPCFDVMLPGLNRECKFVDNITNDIRGFINDSANRKAWGM